jgi:hypothetical protein
LKRALNPVNGPDFILRNRRIADVWAIMEAKGGRGRLGTSQLLNLPTGMSLVRTRGARYQQMGKEWIEYWLRWTIQANRGSPAGDALRSAFSSGIPIPMLAAIVSLNLNRRREFEIAAQAFLPPTGSSLHEWPRGL